MYYYYYYPTVFPLDTASISYPCLLQFVRVHMPIRVFCTRKPVQFHFFCKSTRPVRHYCTTHHQALMTILHHTADRLGNYPNHTELHRPHTATLLSPLSSPPAPQPPRNDAPSSQPSAPAAEPSAPAHPKMPDNITEPSASDRPKTPDHVTGPSASDHPKMPNNEVVPAPVMVRLSTSDSDLKSDSSIWSSPLHHSLCSHNVHWNHHA